MVKEKKGHVKVTLDLETSPSLMDLMKEYVENMQQTMQMIAEYQEKKRVKPTHSVDQKTFKRTLK